MRSSFTRFVVSVGFAVLAVIAACSVSVNAADNFVIKGVVSSTTFDRDLTIVSSSATQGSSTDVFISLQALGDERNLKFSIAFDSNALSFVSASLAAFPDVPAGSLISNPNISVAGHVGLVISSPQAFQAGLRSIVKLTFNVLNTAPIGPTDIVFSDVPSKRQATNDVAEIFPTYVSGTLTVKAPVPPSVTISGRILKPNGQGLSGASVTITAPDNSKFTVSTNQFGNYQIGNVPVGSTYLISVSSKRYRFSARSIPVTDNVTGFDFTGVE